MRTTRRSRCKGIIMGNYSMNGDAARHCLKLARPGRVMCHWHKDQEVPTLDDIFDDLDQQIKIAKFVAALAAPRRQKGA